MQSLLQTYLISYKNIIQLDSVCLNLNLFPLSQILQKGSEWKCKLMSSLGVLRVFKFGQFREQP